MTAGERSENRHPLVRLENLSKSYGSKLAVEPLNLEIRSGDFFALLGPSGCGKTTLLSLIGGFLQPSNGRIVISGEDVTMLAPERRRTNMVFQGYGLFPHMTVRQNIGYGLRVAGLAKEEIAVKVASMVQMVHLGGFEDRLPATLSGGQQQRVALARALVMEPAVLLLDEPLAALDLKLRKAMQEELRALHRSIGGTFVFVTHDQSEAMAIANRIAVMCDGRIEQEGTPEDIYMRPRTEFVASFIGEANLLAGRRENDVITLGCGVDVPSKGRAGAVSIMVRPDDIVVQQTGSAKPIDVRLSGQVADVVFMGNYLRLVVITADGSRIIAHTDRHDGLPFVPSRQANVTLGWKARAHRVIETS